MRKKRGREGVLTPPGTSPPVERTTLVMESERPILDYQTPRRRAQRSILYWMFWAGFGVFVCLVVIAYSAYLARPPVAYVRRGRPKGPIPDLKTALAVFEMDNGRFPTTAEGLDALVTGPPGLTASWRGPYIEAIPRDRWGSFYHYSFPRAADPGNYDFHSIGPDKIDGTADDLADDYAD